MLGFLTEIDCASCTFSTLKMSPGIGACKQNENDRSEHKLHGSAIARPLPHGGYRQNCDLRPLGRGRPCIRPIFSARLASGERFCGSGPQGVCGVPCKNRSRECPWIKIAARTSTGSQNQRKSKSATSKGKSAMPQWKPKTSSSKRLRK